MGVARTADSATLSAAAPALSVVAAATVVTSPLLAVVCSLCVGLNTPQAMSPMNTAATATVAGIHGRSLRSQSEVQRGATGCGLSFSRTREGKRISPRTWSSR